MRFNIELMGYEYKSERDKAHSNASVYALKPIERQGSLF